VRRGVDAARWERGGRGEGEEGKAGRGDWYVVRREAIVDERPADVELPAMMTAASVHRPPSTQLRSLESSFSAALSALNAPRHGFESGSDERHRLRDRRASELISSPLSIKRAERRETRRRR
jgi:hypothetical protein